MNELASTQKLISTTLEEFETLKNVNSHLSEIELQLKTAYEKIRKMDGQLEKELKDIDDLEKIGVKSLFYKTLGNKEEQLEKERQEYLELSLKYNQYKKEVELMEYERDLLSKKVNQLPEVKSKLELLKQQRKREILASNLPIKHEYQELTNKLDVQISLQKELNEAIHEGNKSIQILTTVLSYLSKAGDWGKWDMYGDRNAKYHKRKSMDLAIRHLPKANHQLKMFLRELRDLGENDIEVKLDTIHFDKFTDFFFDNLISDWIVQQRILSTANNVSGSKDYVQRIIMSLKQEVEAVSSTIADLRHLSEKILLSS